MESRKCLFFLLLVSFTFTSGFCDCDENGSWMREFSFGSNKNVTIKWNFTDDTLRMAMIGSTKGWVAVGFSTTKSLNGADILIGWVDDKTNKSYLQDRHGDAKNQSLLDDKNSYTLLNATQTDNSTVICWERKLVTCDKQDVEITFSTFRVIWAVGQEDPPQENFDPPPNLGPSMGIQNIRLLSLEYPKPSSSDIQSIDFVAKNIKIEKDDTGTVYWCSHLTVPKSQKESHLVAFEPIVQKENVDIFHHFLLYECPPKFMKTFGWGVPEEGYSCFDPLRFAYQDLCIITLNVWAVGGTSVNYPEDIGLPFHKTDENRYYMLQSHYNVRDLKSTRRDNSGVRMYYTYKLRPRVVGQLGFGANVNPFQLIPPRQKNFTSLAICDKNCTTSTIPESGIKVLAVMFHSHLAGRKIKLRIIRKGQELEPLADDNYDFDYQQQSFLSKPIDVMPGDTFLSECVYDTSSRNYTTVGAFGTSEEMCLIFLLHEPPIDFSWCQSYVNPMDIYNLTEIGAILPLPKFCFGSDCEYTYAAQGVPNLVGYIMLPLKYFGKKLTDYLRDYQWSDSKIKTLQSLSYKNQIPLCKTGETPFNSTKTDVATYPTEFTPYKKPDVCAANSS